MLNNWLRGLFAATIGLTSLAVATSAWARDDADRATVGLDHNVALTGAFGFGDRFGTPGKQVIGRVEGGGYWMTSRFGNRGGVEGGAELGYDGLSQTPPGHMGQPSVLSNMLFDLWLGFPMTLLEFGEGSGRWFTTGLTPGMGFSDKHLYWYIKGKMAVRVGSSLTVEGSWQWTPFDASTTLGSFDDKPGSGLNLAILRTSVYYKLQSGRSLIFTLDWRQSNLESPNPAASGAALAAFADQTRFDSNVFLHMDKVRADNNVRAGIGYAW